MRTNVSGIGTRKPPFDVKSISSKILYWKFTDTCTHIVQRDKWIDLFGFDRSSWEIICSLPFKCTFETKLQSFQFSVLYRFVPYKAKLHLMGLAESPTCDFCPERDTLLHRFVECRCIKMFWISFARWWTLATGDNLIVSAKDILLGYYDGLKYPLNNCILTAKYFIHIQKCKSVAVTFEACKVFLKHHVLFKNKQMHLFTSRWEKLLRSLLQ